MNNLIPLDELARLLGVHRTNALKIALAMGYEPKRQQVLSLGHHQRVSCWTPEQVQQIVARRREDGFALPEDAQ